MLTTVTRSGRVESWHRGAVAVWHDDEPWLGRGDVAAPVVCRSATKPLQALPLLERDRERALSAAEVALICASHEGTDAHTAVVRALLARGGFGEGDLGCGPHAPFDSRTRRQLAQAGLAPGRLHNNCSGKHAGFLLLARACGEDPRAYLDPASRSQTEVMAAVAAMAGVPSPIERGVDGCGAPTFVLPLQALARAFARLANPTDLGTVRAAACDRILQAAGREPILLAGEKRICAALIATAPGRLFAKNGAEGVYAVALRPDPARRSCPGAVGIAIKVFDGQSRGYEPVVVDLLQHLGCFPGGEVPAALQPFWRQPLRNTRNEEVGEVRCAVDWSRS